MRKFRECPNIKDEIVFIFFLVLADVSSDYPAVGINNELFSAIYVLNMIKNGNLAGVVLMFFVKLNSGVFYGPRMYILGVIFRT